MQSLVALSVSKSKVKRDDDFVDRLSHRYTCVILVIFATIICTKQYVGSPITCWVPKQFTGSMTKYTNSYCWVNDTYYLPFHEEIPKPDEDHKRHMILYYQWIPFILLLQAVFFYIPTVLWHGLNQKAGIDSDNILDAAANLQRTEKVDSRDNLLVLIVNQMHRFLHSRQDRVASWKISLKNCANVICCGCCGKRMGSYLVILFVISKLFYGLNIIAQLLLLSKVFNTDFATFGLDFFNPAQDGAAVNPTFPRVTMCDFHVRTLGNLHRYTVQCVLPVNLYMELMYVFLWFWMILVAIATFLSLVTWLLRFALRRDKVRFVTNHLVMMDRAQDEDTSRLVDDFVDEYLRQDGAFVLRLIAHNTNNITTTEITCALWDNWLKIRSPKEVSTDVMKMKPMNGGNAQGDPPGYFSEEKRDLGLVNSACHI